MRRARPVGDWAVEAGWARSDEGMTFKSPGAIASLARRTVPVAPFRDFAPKGLSVQPTRKRRWPSSPTPWVHLTFGRTGPSRLPLLL